MRPSWDTIIVGAGLAGACAAWSLCQRGRVLLLDARHPAAGASGVAAGLVNPLMGLKARAVWRADEALTALHTILRGINAPPLAQHGGLLRPATSPAQAQAFRAVAETYPQRATWLSIEAAREHFPGLAMHKGAMHIRQGGAIHVSDFVKAILDDVQQHGGEIRAPQRVTGWGEDGEGAFVTLPEEDKRIYAQRVVLAMGYGYHRFPALAALNLHAVKGQVVRVARPATLPREGLLPLSGQGYIVPEKDAFTVGSSYERGFTDVEPSVTQTRRILAKAAHMLPALKGAHVLTTRAGVRVTVPGTRLPMLGPLPGHTNIWVFTGLGSKGLLMAPLLARDLPLFFDNPAAIPPVIRVR